MNHNISTKKIIIDKLDEILKIGLYMLIFFIPVSIGATNTISALLFVMILVRLSLRRDYILFKGVYNKAIYLFLMLILLSAFFAGEDYMRTLHGFVSPVLKYVIVYILTVNLIKTKEDFKKVLIFYWIATMVGAGYAGYQYYFAGMRRPDGFTHNANRLGSIMMIFNILNYSFLIFVKDKKYKLLALCGIVFGFIGLTASMSRSALISMVIGLFVVSLLKDKRLIILFLLVVLIFFIFMPDSYLNRFERLTDIESHNVSQRILCYRIGFKLFKMYPITGIGFEAVKGIYDRFEIAEFDKLTFPYGHLHNIFINIAAEMGSIGLASFLFLLYLTVKKAWSLFMTKENAFSACVLGIIAGQIFQNTVDVNMHATEVGLVFVLMISLMIVVENNGDICKADILI